MKYFRITLADCVRTGHWKLQKFEKCNIVRMSIHELRCRVYAILIKIPIGNFKEIDKLIIRYIWKGKAPSTAKKLWKKKKNQRTSKLIIKATLIMIGNIDIGIYNSHIDHIDLCVCVVSIYILHIYGQGCR